MRIIPMAVLALLPLATGCGVGPGDYAIYRIAFAQSEASADCFPDGEDPDDASDTTSFRAGATFAIFKSGDTFYLDLEGDVLAGAKADGALTFTGETVDVEVFGNNDASTITNTSKLTVTTDLGGASVDGTAVNSEVQTCSGADCDTFDSYSCSGTSTFVGTRVEGVELEYAL